GAPLFGRNPVLEALRAEGRSVEEVAILSEGRGPALQELLTLARSRQVKVSYRTRDQLNAMAGTTHHQGVVARVSEASYASLDDLLRVPSERGEPAFFLEHGPQVPQRRGDGGARGHPAQASGGGPHAGGGE